MLIKEYVIVYTGNLKNYFSARRKAFPENSVLGKKYCKTPWVLKFLMKKKAEDRIINDIITVKSIPCPGIYKFLPKKLIDFLEKLFGKEFIEITSYSRESKHYFKTEIDIKLLWTFTIRYEVFFFYSRKKKEKIRQRYDPTFNEDFDYLDLEEISIKNQNTIVNIMQNITKKITWLDALQTKPRKVYIYHKIIIKNPIPLIPTFINFSENIIAWIFHINIIIKETKIAKFLI
mmetsp:Transcript_15136/g.36611  ORF Transcript_15136/g.36611 Transcript_15136/m.36611 type:complete len:232 (-) Transcript_15136:78-773(-)